MGSYNATAIVWLCRALPAYRTHLREVKPVTKDDRRVTGVGSGPRAIVKEMAAPADRGRNRT